MPAPSPICTINGSAAPQDVSAGSTVTIALVSTAGVGTWFLTCTQTDETSSASSVNGTLVVNQTTKTATYTHPGAGTAVIFQSTVTAPASTGSQGFGRDVNNNLVAAFTTTFAVHCKTAQGLRTIASNETLEGSLFGWISKINAAIRAVATGTIAVSGSGLVHATSGTLDASAYHGTAGQFLLTNAGATDTAWASLSGTDVSASTGTPGLLTVTGIRNNSVPAPSGTNTTLLWSGSAFSWGTPGASGVTWGPTDLLTSTNSAQYVAAISGANGAGGTVPLHINRLQFDNSQVLPGIGLAAPGSDIATTTLQIIGQPAFSNVATHAPGDVEIALGHSTSGVGGGNARWAVSEGGTRFATFGRVDADNAAFMWLGAAAATPLDTNSVLDVDSSGSPSFNSPALGSSIISMDATGATQVTSTNNQPVAIYATSWNVAEYYAADIQYFPGGTRFAAEFGLLGTRQFVALCAGTQITTTQMPTGTGDGVVYVGNRTARPTVSPTLGAELFAEAGQLWVMPGNGSNTAFQIQPGVVGGITQLTGDVTAGPGSGSQASTLAKIQGTTVTMNTVSALGLQLIGTNASGTVWQNIGISGDLTSSSQGVFNVAGLSGANNTTAAIPLRSSAYISVTASQPIIRQGANDILQTDGTGHTALQAVNGVTFATQSVTLGRLWAATTDYIAFGATPGSSGFLRVTNNSTIIASNGSALFSIDASNNVNVVAPATLTLGNGGATQAQFGNGVGDFLFLGTVLSGVTVNPTNITWYPQAINPLITQTTPASDLATNTLSITAQSAFAGASTNVNGGPVFIAGGHAKSDGGTGLRGRVTLGLTAVFPMVEVAEVVVGQKILALCATTTVSSTNMPASSGDGVIFVANALSVPAANATGGGILYAQAGAIKWRGSSGTITTMGTAEPHCPACGADFMTEHENDVYGYLSVCLKCMADELGERPWIVRKKAA